jgi:NNP family nitrate/nitrite transporter-like MFS transporter
MSHVRDLFKVGHWPSLAAGLLHFETSFAVWVMLGALGPFIASDLRLSPSQKGLVVATPLLAAAAFRILVGWLSDSYGPRRVGTASMAFVTVPLILAWTGGNSFGQMLGVGVLLGVAGASFAVALPLASSHYPPSHQGVALGIAGAGNSGTVLTALLAPRIAEHIGWRTTMGLAVIPVTLAALGFWLLARDAEGPRPRGRLRDALAPLRETDCWRLCGMYAVTFGGFVGLSAFLPILFVDRFGVSKIAAGTLAAAAAFAGSLMRPVGGVLADRFGGTRVLAGVFVVASGLALALAWLPGIVASEMLFIALLGSLGAGNGAVFQLVPLRFPDRVGLATGIIGAAGGVGGFFLPSLLGVLRQATGSYRLGFGSYAAVAVVALFSIIAIRIAWTRRVPIEQFGEAAI